MFNEFINAVFPQLLILAFLYFAVLCAIGLDLIAGIRKAKARGEYRSSTGYRRTVDKVGRYFNMIFVVTLIDVVQMLGIFALNQQTAMKLPILPLLTFVAAIFAGFIEPKSIYETNDEKEKAKINEVAKLAGSVIKDHDTTEIVAAVINYMKTQPEGAKKDG